MNKNKNINQKGVESEYLIFGGSENEEKKYRGNQEMSADARERVDKWTKKQKAKLGKITLFAFEGV